MLGVTSLYCGSDDVRWDQAQKQFFCTFCGRRFGKDWWETAVKTNGRKYEARLLKQCQLDKDPFPP